MIHAWHWLIAQGLYHFLVGWGVGLFMSGMVLPFVRKFWRRRRTELNHIVDLLSVETKGGLHDVKEPLDKILELVQQVAQGPGPPYDWEKEPRPRR